MVQSPTSRVATAADEEFLRRYDTNITADELRSAVGLGRVHVAEVDHEPVGWLRWNLFWDQVPFMNLLYVLEPHRRCGVGHALVEHWERRVAANGHAYVLTSTLASETAQHFYRRLGYRDAGALLLPQEPLEIILHKAL